MAEYQDNIAFVIFHCFIVFFFIILHVFGIIPSFLINLVSFTRALRDSMTQQLTNVEKLVLGKMTKQQYMDAETPLHKKKEEQLEKIKTILSGI